MNNGRDNKFKIAVVENNRFIRSSWEMIFKESHHFEFIGSYNDCEEAFKDKMLEEADVVLIDIRLPGISLTEALKYFRTHYPDQVQIISTNYEDDENIFDTIAAGAAGFLPKNIPPQILCDSIVGLVNGRSSMTPHIARCIIETIEKSNAPYGNPANSFNQEEWDLLLNISSGKSYSTVAEETQNSVEDILHMIGNIYEKIRLKSKSGIH